jgi:hypothetical protein
VNGIELTSQHPGVMGNKQEVHLTDADIQAQYEAMVSQHNAKLAARAAAEKRAKLAVAEKHRAAKAVRRRATKAARKARRGSR